MPRHSLEPTHRRPRTTNEMPPLKANPIASTARPNLHPCAGDVAAELIGALRRGLRSKRAAGYRRHRAADLAEVLEDDAEHDRHAGGYVAAADPRLGDRTDKRHALVLVDRGQGRVKA